MIFKSIGNLFVSQNTWQAYQYQHHPSKTAEVTVLKKGCVLYMNLGSLHHLRSLKRGCVLYAGAPYTRKITVSLQLNCIYQKFVACIFSPKPQSPHTELQCNVSVHFPIINEGRDNDDEFNKWLKATHGVDVFRTVFIKPCFHFSL